MANDPGIGGNIARVAWSLFAADFDNVAWSTLGGGDRSQVVGPWSTDLDSDLDGRPHYVSNVTYDEDLGSPFVRILRAGLYLVRFEATAWGNITPGSDRFDLGIHVNASAPAVGGAPGTPYLAYARFYPEDSGEHMEVSSLEWLDEDDYVSCSIETNFNAGAIDLGSMDGVKFQGFRV
jgi:hypothetical protein